MIQTLIGQKVDQSQKFLENGRRIPVTEVSVADNVVVQVKTAETDKYVAVQLGYGAKKRPTKALVGHVKKAKLAAVPAYVREVAWESDQEMPVVGTNVTVDSVFKAGDKIQVTGTSKGKGFAGVMKRHNFGGGPKTHGQSDRERAPGSIGQTTTPGRVYRGKKMAGHMGVDTVTVQNLTVVDVDAVNKKLYVLGLVPGHKKTMLTITRMGEQKDFVPLLKAKEEETVVAPVADEPTTVVEAAAELETKKEAAESTSVDSEKVEATSDVAESKEDAKVAEEPKKEEKDGK